MAKKKKGFFDGLIEDIIYHGVVEAARDPVTGKVDPYAAAGIAFGSGKMKTFGDQMRLAAHLGAAGAFDPDSDSSVSSSSYSNDDWRMFCEDGSEYGIDPLEYETEAEYLAAIESEKYEWRNWYTSEAKEYGLSLTDYENEELFLAAIEAVQSGIEPKEIRKSDDTLADAEEAIIEALEDVALISDEDSPILSVEPTAPSVKRKDPLEETDKTVYTFCGVTFPHGDTIYHYLTNDDSLSIGDFVVVPAGFSNNEVICEIETIEKHRRKTAPYPVDRAKYIIGRHVDDNSEGSSTSSNGDTSSAHKMHSDLNAFAISDGITDMLLAKGLRYEDNRSKGGKVWIYDSPDVEMVIRQVETRFGVKFIYTEHGGKATNGKPAWYMK